MAEAATTWAVRLTGYRSDLFRAVRSATPENERQRYVDLAFASINRVADDDEEELSSVQFPVRSLADLRIAIAIADAAKVCEWMLTADVEGPTVQTDAVLFWSAWPDQSRGPVFGSVKAKGNTPDEVQRHLDAIRKSAHELGQLTKRS